MPKGSETVPVDLFKLTIFAYGIGSPLEAETTLPEITLVESAGVTANAWVTKRAAHTVNKYLALLLTVFFVKCKALLETNNTPQLHYNVV